MEDLATLGLEIRSDGVAVATDRLGALDRQARLTEASARAFKVAMGIAVAGSLAFSVGIYGAIQRLEEMDRLSKQLDRALHNVGNTARTSAMEVERWADKLEERTGRAAEEVMAVSSNLATFGFGRETFFRAIELADDMAAAWGGDLKQNLEGLSRALDDPEKGFAMLQKRGVQLSDTQKMLVHDFMAVNDKASAQGVVFEALESQVKGVAEDGYGGLTKAWGLAKKAWEDAFEDMVKGEGQSGDLRKSLEELAATISSPEFIGAIIGFGKIMVQVVNSIAQAVVTAWNALNDFLEWANGPGAQMAPGATLQSAYPQAYGNAESSLNRDLQFMGNTGTKGRGAGDLYSGFNFGADGGMVIQGKGDGYNPYEGQTFGAEAAAVAAEKAKKAYDDLIMSSEARIASLEAEAQAMGLTTIEAQNLSNLHELIADAEATGIEMTDARIDQLIDLSERMTNAQLTLEAMHVELDNQGPWETFWDSIEHTNALMQTGEMSARSYAMEIGRAAGSMVSSYASGANDVIGNIEKITDAMGLQGEEAFNIQKALGIARAVVSGGESIVHSFNAGTAIGGPPVGFAFAGIAAAATAAQVAAIASSSYQSKTVPNMGGGGASTTAAPAAPARASANVTLVGNSFGRDQVRELLEQIADYGSDTPGGVSINVRAA